MHLIHQVGPHAPDSSYARVSFDTSMPFGRERDTPTVANVSRDAGLTIEWSKLGEASTVGCLSISFAGRLQLHGYFPWDWKDQWHTDYGASDEHPNRDKRGGQQIARREISGLTADGERAIAVVLKQIGAGNRKHRDSGPRSRTLYSTGDVGTSRSHPTAAVSTSTAGAYYVARVLSYSANWRWPLDGSSGDTGCPTRKPSGQSACQPPASHHRRTGARRTGAGCPATGRNAQDPVDAQALEILPSGALLT